jgi:transcriptional regulator with XRE-family HTH domain
MTEMDPSPPCGPEGSPKTFAERLNFLFDTVHPPGRGPYSNSEVARGAGITVTYVGYLRKGLRDNPTKAHIEALAGFFGIPPTYFFDGSEGPEVARDLALLSALKHAGAREVALRAAFLDPTALRALVPMLECLGTDTPGQRMEPVESPPSGPAPRSS